ncbi:hypothetical protein G6F46_007208 [Rhizopus delemar]|uniref:Uncharacterized protein n=2 Tax=Rhizopus TaxID=4842 RepID=A0A9P7CNM6_9FUNG|nr:hypothetical protein G6F55_005875 [Rhizopus delemar]KAG1543892.1 hypothetical protein G6F51_006396 [Rhizopus arrhizus]KAG1497691.1 hypothetical protein G6F54_005594 [Rhizopus delemar]KAG1511430.1 hypothetical protein G6F53_005947 [Rhizopus delemar]KAG1523968.1 hypothetical protein G6F52_004585 [Rhizopus delemar]
MNNENKDLNAPDIKASFIIKESKAKYFYRYDQDRFELRQVDNNQIIKEIHSADFIKDELILTIGTLDSALYVIRVNSTTLLESEWPCILARTDARSALTQSVLVTNNTVYVIVGGSNGVLDIFLLKQGKRLEFCRHQLLQLPSNLPIVNVQCFEQENYVALVISQQLKQIKPLTKKRGLEPSITITKLDTASMVFKDTVFKKSQFGTHLLPAIQIEDDDDDKRIYQLKTLYLDVKEGVINTCNFDETKWEFNDEKHNLYLEIEQKTGSLQDIFILEKTCFLLDKEKMHQLEIKEKQGKKRELEERE